MTTRLLPPTDARYQTMQANGRTYAAAPGAVADVPDQDAAILGANGWTTIAPSGVTGARPTKNPDGTFPINRGQHFVDTSIGKIVVFDGLTWRDPVTGSAA